jgi:hypothetical protein
MALQFAVSFAGGERMFIKARRWPFRIGRDARNDLCLAESENISRLHARVIQQDGKHFLIVTGRNPSFLNNRVVPIDEAQPLNAGDVIEFPDYRLEVQESSEQARSSNPTVALQVIPDDNRLIRLIASALGISSWSIEGILGWLQAEQGREILIHQRHFQLCLTGNLNAESLRQRLDLFDELQRPHDQRDIRVEVIDSSRPGS